MSEHDITVGKVFVYKKVILYVSVDNGNNHLRHKGLASRLINLALNIIKAVRAGQDFDREYNEMTLDLYHADLKAVYPNLKNIENLYKRAKRALA